MIDVKSLPEVEPDPQGGWQLALWMGDAFDYGIPFRAALAEMVECLGKSQPASLDLPPRIAHEDFVEGALTFGPNVLGVYYEHSLGYLSLFHDNRGVIEAVAMHLEPLLTVR